MFLIVVIGAGFCKACIELTMGLWAFHWRKTQRNLRLVHKWKINKKKRFGERLDPDGKNPTKLSDA